MLPAQAWHMRHAGAVAEVVGRGVGLRVVVVGFASGKTKRVLHGGGCGLVYAVKMLIHR